MLLTLDEAEKEFNLTGPREFGPFSVFPAGQFASIPSKHNASRDWSPDPESPPGSSANYEATEYSVLVDLDVEIDHDMGTAISADSFQDSVEIDSQTSSFCQNDWAMSSLLDLEPKTHFFSDKTANSSCTTTLQLWWTSFGPQAIAKIHTGRFMFQLH